VGRNLGRSKNSAGYVAAAAALDAGVKRSRMQWREKPRAARYVGGDLLAVGESHVHAGSKTPIEVQNGQGGAFAADQFARHQKSASARRRRSRLRAGKRDAQKEE